MNRVRNFASDNNSGACPEVLEILERCNRDHAAGYGEDLWTKRASDLLRDLFQIDCEVFFCFQRDGGEFIGSVKYLSFVSQYSVS